MQGKPNWHIPCYNTIYCTCTVDSPLTCRCLLIFPSWHAQVVCPCQGSPPILWHILQIKEAINRWQRSLRLTAWLGRHVQYGSMEGGAHNLCAHLQQGCRARKWEIEGCKGRNQCAACRSRACTSTYSRDAAYAAGVSQAL